MRYRLNGLLAVALIWNLFAFALTACAEPQSAELQVLNRFVGEWHGKATLINAKGQKTTIEDEAKMQWVLGDSYIEDRVEDSLFGLWTYDRDVKAYRSWYFVQGSHKPMTFTTHWNAEDTSFSGKVDLGNGVTLTSVHKFIGDDKFEWSAIIKDAGGKVLSQHSGYKIRR